MRRLILEVQAQRYALPELRMLVQQCRIAAENQQPLERRVKQLNTVLRQIDAQIHRADKIYRSTPAPHPNAPPYRA